MKGRIVATALVASLFTAAPMWYWKHATTPVEKAELFYPFALKSYGVIPLSEEKESDESLGQEYSLDRKDNTEKRYNNVLSFYVGDGSCVRVRTSYLTLEEQCKDSMSWQASGVLLEHSQTQQQYVLSVEHITPGEYHDCKEKDKPVRKLRVLKSEVRIEDVPATIVKEDSSVDLALFKLAGNLQLQPYKGKIAEELHEGDYILGFGLVDGKKKFFPATVSIEALNRTWLDTGITPGNSGGSAFKVTNESMELTALIKNTGGEVVPPAAIRAFLQGTALEKDYLK